MYSMPAHHTLQCILAISLLGACCLGQPAAADPVVLQNAAANSAESVTPLELSWTPAVPLVEDLAELNPNMPTPNHADQTPSPRSQPRPDPTNPPMPQLGTRAAPDLAAEIRSTLKESIRPMHEQVMDSSVMAAWNDLKSDLGLSKTKEGDEATSTEPIRTSGHWDTSNPAPGLDPGHRPKTAEQVEMDRELAAHLLEKLINEITPWAITALGLYLLVYLAKTGYDHTQRKSIRRRERSAAHARRRSTRRTTSTKPEA